MSCRVSNISSTLFWHYMTSCRTKFWVQVWDFMCIHTSSNTTLSQAPHSKSPGITQTGIQHSDDSEMLGKGLFLTRSFTSHGVLFGQKCARNTVLENTAALCKALHKSDGHGGAQVLCICLCALHQTSWREKCSFSGQAGPVYPRAKKHYLFRTAFWK